VKKDHSVKTKQPVAIAKTAAVTYILLI